MTATSEGGSSAESGLSIYVHRWLFKGRAEGFPAACENEPCAVYLSAPACMAGVSIGCLAT